MKKVSIRVLEHRFSSVPQGLFPEQGPGFQTFAAVEELIGTEDLRCLEQAAYYAVSRERRGRGDLPIKHTFFRLPSGNYALGRTEDAGVDALGREGNYLTQHRVIKAEALRTLEGNPFTLLYGFPWQEYAPDRQAGILPVLECDIELAERNPAWEMPIPWERVADLAALFLHARGQTVLITAEADALPLLRGLFAVLPIEERMALTFCTHFYRSESLRPLFALVMVDALDDAPSDLSSYLRLTSHVQHQKDAYAGWLREHIQQAQWYEIEEMNALVNGLRAEQATPALAKTAPSLAADTYEALWEQVGERMFPLLYGSLAHREGFLSAFSAASAPIDALLQSASPALLLGSDLPAEAIATCLKLLESKASPGVWRQWTKRWKNDLLLAHLPPAPWWHIRR